MPTDLFARDVRTTLAEFQRAATNGTTKTVTIGGQTVTIPYPFPSPGDWRDHWIYFLMIDRFANATSAPTGKWNRRYDLRQGGTFNGIRQQLPYLRDLGVGAVWMTPVLKNAKPAWQYNYHGYGAQDFLVPDERFASDGTRATAEQELTALVEEAHALGLYVILDIVFNHAARVFDYLRNGQAVSGFQDNGLLYGPLGNEPPIQWLNGFGFPRSDWQAPPGWPSGLPDPSLLSPDDAVWPVDLQRADFFRRRGGKTSDDPPDNGYIPGDFGDMRQLVADYLAPSPSDPLRQRYGERPVLDILIRIHQYLIARYDFDGFRIDTVKYVSPRTAEIFGNAIREFALSCGKRNFFTFGEIWSENEDLVAKYVGRNSTDVYSFGIDAALDFPLTYALAGAAKALGHRPVEGVRRVFENRKQAERELLSSHGEAGRFFVTFLDNHDQPERFLHPQTPQEQLTLALAVLFCLQGIPCLYYGTEQGLTGTVHSDGSPALGSNESVREALWGKTTAFDQTHPLYVHIQNIAEVRREEPAIRYGRLYFREVSGNGRDFGQSTGAGGLLAFSRILVDREVLVVANTHASQGFSGSILVDPDLHRGPKQFRIAYSNRATAGTSTVQQLAQATFHGSGGTSSGPASVLGVALQPMEVQILLPA